MEILNNFNNMNLNHQQGTYDYYLTVNGILHTLRSPLLLTQEILGMYHILIQNGYVVTRNADDAPTAVVYRNGVEVCLVERITAYIFNDDDDGEEVIIFNSIQDLLNRFG